MTDFVGNLERFTYRVTGKQSVERLVPLIRQIVPHAVDCDTIEECKQPIDLVWETTCEKEQRLAHQCARVTNKLHNSIIIESKSHLAYLQLLIPRSMLETKVSLGAKNVDDWARRRWFDKQVKDSSQNPNRDWWVVKASHGNGGRDVWIMNSSNASKVISELADNEEYVIQR
jgi:hypothetical protein